MNNITEMLNKFGIDFTIYSHIKTGKAEYISLILSLNGKTLDGRHKLSKLLIKYLNVNYKARYIRGALNIKL